VSSTSSVAGSAATSDERVAVASGSPDRTPGPGGWLQHAGYLLVDAVSPWIDRLVGDGARWARLPQGRRVAVGWVVTRAIMLLLLALPQQTIINDVTYYFDNLHSWALSGSFNGVLHEYPLPVILLVGIPYPLSFGNHMVYDTLFVVMMLAIDAAFCRLLFTHGGRRQTAAVTLWLAAGVMMGPLAVTRFDVVPGVLAGASLLLLARHPRTASVFVAFGAALKLWPAVLLPALAAPRATRWRVVAAAVVSAVVVVGATVAIGGPQRLLSPLQWQSERGLQVESLPALPLMIMWSIFRAPWLVEFSSFVSQQVYGPGGHLMLQLSTLATGLALLWMAVMWLRMWLAGDSITAETVGWMMLASTGLLILTNKVFSPQYLLWLSPVAIAMVALAPRRDTGVRRFTVLLLLVGVLTQLIYPIVYGWVVGIYWANPIGVLLLAVRDVALIGFVIYAGRRAWRESSRRREVVDVPLPAEPAPASPAS
jgi:hypothetical protein